MDSVLAVVTLSAAVAVRFPSLLTALSVRLKASLASVIAVVSPSGLQFAVGVSDG